MSAARHGARTLARRPQRPRGMLRSLRRGLAEALLIGSILPVLLLGPGILRAPETLARRAITQLQRLEAGARNPVGAAVRAERPPGTRRPLRRAPARAAPTGLRTPTRSRRARTATSAARATARRARRPAAGGGRAR